MTFLPRNSVIKRVHKVLSNLHSGSVTLVTPEGETHVFRGANPGPDADITVHDWSVARNAMLRGDIGLGEDYIAGKWESSDIEALFTVFLTNMEAVEKDYAHGGVFSRIGFLIYDRILRRNSRKGSKSNIKAHYDVGNEFYRLWLDRTMTYSSAIYLQPNTPLETAQQSKYARILDRIGDSARSILEIGCGWGGFAEEAVSRGRHVKGLTISKAQHDFASSRVAGKADIALQDYRDVSGLFDAIVSIEMFEAVGEKYWPDYFKTVSARLKKDGKAMIQTITIGDEFFKGYRMRSDFIRQYVFPGGMLPSLQIFKDEAARAGLVTTDVYAFGQDYARTLREWLRNFEAKLDEIRAMGYSEAFVRNWRFYLAVCAATFASGRTNVMQIELQHA